jgi:hypothetical protein
MNNALFSLTVLAVTLPALAHAQPEVEQRFTPRSNFQVSAGAALPVGDAADVLDVGFAALGSYHYQIRPQLTITGRTGLIYETGDGVDVIHVPLLGGVEYALAPTPNHVFLAGELGLVYLRASVDTGFGSVSDSETELGASLGAGYRFGNMDIAGTVYIPSLDETDDSIHVMARLGFRL